MAVYSDIRKAVRRASIQSLIEFFPATDSQNKGIIFSHVNGSEPSTPYVVINILGIEQQGKHVTSPLLDSSQTFVNVRAAYEITVQFSFCGSTAGDMAQSFTQRINNNPLSLESLTREKLSVMRKSTIRRAPQKRDTQWVEYFNQDVVFAYVINTEQPIDWVETVIVDNEYTGTFTVPEGVPIP